MALVCWRRRLPALLAEMLVRKCTGRSASGHLSGHAYLATWGRSEWKRLRYVDSLLDQVVKSFERDGWIWMRSVSWATLKPLVAERHACAIEHMKAGTARLLGFRMPRPPCLLVS